MQKRLAGLWQLSEASAARLGWCCAVDRSTAVCGHAAGRGPHGDLLACKHKHKSCLQAFKALNVLSENGGMQRWAQRVTAAARRAPALEPIAGAG